MCYFVGIDVAKLKHDFTIVTDVGEIIVKPTTFSNDAEGYKQLKDSLTSLDHSQEIKIGLESTGHYHKNLVKFLNDLGFEVEVLNPYLVRKFIEARTLRKQKTDKLDCFWVAQYLQSLGNKTYQTKSYTNDELKSLTRERDKTVATRSQQYVIMTNALDHIFPEYRKNVDSRLTKTSLALFALYPNVTEISKLTPAKLDKLKNKFSGIRLNKIQTAIAYAKVTIGHPSEAQSFILQEAAKHILFLNELIKEYETKISQILKKIDSPLLSIPGVGMISAASIIGEYSNFEGFSSPDKLLSYAGLECSRYQSGTVDHTGKMVKRGSPHLRFVLMNLAVSLKNNNAIFSSYYLKKKDEGKCYRVALNHVVRKFLRMAFKLVSSDSKFDINLAK